MHSQYEVPGTVNFDDHISLSSPLTYPKFQEDLSSFQTQIQMQVSQGTGATYLKFGDGDYYFLKGKRVGSAAPGARAISRPVSWAKRQKFIKMANGVDYMMCEIYPENRRRFDGVFRGRQIDFPAEIVYGLVANRWLINQTGGQVGLIGASQKLDLIKELLTHHEYRDYLGIEEFADYIPIPQKFAADSPEALSKDIGARVESSSAKVFLMGIGHVKSWLIPALSSYRETIYLDIGSGIDALAGIIDSKRPYFGAWKNYRLPRSDWYTGIDYLQFNNENIFQL